MHIRQDVAVPAQPKHNPATQIAASHPHHIEEMAALGDPIAMHAIARHPELNAPNWEPLEKLCPPGLCEQFMFMGSIDGIYLYKHVDSRRYLNVDVLGATYAYNPATSKYDPVPISAAMKILAQDTLLETFFTPIEIEKLSELLLGDWAQVEKLFPPAELSMGEILRAVHKAVRP